MALSLKDAYILVSREHIDGDDRTTPTELSSNESTSSSTMTTTTTTSSFMDIIWQSLPTISNLWPFHDDQDKPDQLLTFNEVEFDDVAAKMAFGDIILFHGEHSLFSEIVEGGTKSKWSHVGIVIRAPLVIFQSDSSGVKQPHILGEPGQVLMLESGYEGKIRPDIEDHKPKLGVQIVPLDADYIAEYDGIVAWRRLVINTGESDTDAISYGNSDGPHFSKMLAEFQAVHDIIHDKTYDLNPIDWLRALFRLHVGDEFKISSFFCSALAACVYAKFGIIEFPKNSGWDQYRPKDFSSEVTRTPGLVDGVRLTTELVLRPKRTL